jgi:hypothetical protein
VLDGLAPSLAVGSFLYERVSLLPHLERATAGSLGLDGFLYVLLASALLLMATARRLDADRS